MAEPREIRILVADDEPLFLRTTGELLRKAGYDCVCVPDASAAIAALMNERFDLVLSDLNMPGNLKLELLHSERENWPDVPLIVVTGVPSLPTAIEGLRLGIADYLLKPVSYKDLLSSIQRVLGSRQHASTTQHRGDTQAGESARRFPGIVAESSLMLQLLDIVDRVTKTDTNVLITGESGTGKEVVARTIHEHGRRAEHGFQVIDCTAIPETLFDSVLCGDAKGSSAGAIQDQRGLLQQCGQGTAFFDEIGDLSPVLQSKMLRLVQERTFTPAGNTEPIRLDARFICATTRDLELEVNARRFRNDLLYRLAVVHIELPPLRDRGEDVVLLARHFRDRMKRTHPRVTAFSDKVLSCFRGYTWPGNVRELRNVVEHAMALARSSQVEWSDLPPSLRKASYEKPPQMVLQHSVASRAEKLGEVEREYLISLLQQNGGNVSRSAKQAGMSRQGLHKLLKKHGISATEHRR